MNAAFALIPVILIRFLLLGALDKNALRRAAVFPMPGGRAVIAYWLYLITNLLLYVCPFFLKISPDGAPFYIALGVYLLGTAVYAISMIHFAAPDGKGLTVGGLYKFSRNPMYVGYFFYFLGLALLTRSLLLLAVLVIFQIATHWIILAEEQWCINEFGEDYISYMQKVRRYF